MLLSKSLSIHRSLFSLLMAVTMACQSGKTLGGSDLLSRPWLFEWVVVVLAVKEQG